MAYDGDKIELKPKTTWKMKPELKEQKELFTRTHIWSTEMIGILAGLWTLLELGVVVQTQERSLQSTLLTWKIYTITLLTQSCQPIHLRHYERQWLNRVYAIELC